MAKVRDEQLPPLRQAGLSLEWREFDKEHTVAGEPELAMIREFLRTAYGRPAAGPG
jgi:hypothetical protein